jgi:hypothetical protein
MALVRQQTLDIHTPVREGQCWPFPATETKHKSLPYGYPRVLESPLAWDGAELTESHYINRLSDSDVEEVKEALEYFKCKNSPMSRTVVAPANSDAALELDGRFVNRNNFPLKHLGNRLKKLCYEIHNGKGFGLVRGLDPANFTVEDGMTVFLGIQSYIAEERAQQDSKGNMVGKYSLAAPPSALADYSVHIISDSKDSASSSTRALHARYSTSSIV